MLNTFSSSSFFWGGGGGGRGLFLFFLTEGCHERVPILSLFLRAVMKECQCTEGCHERVPVLSLLLRAASVKSLSLLPRTFVEKCQC